MTVSIREKIYDKIRNDIIFGRLSPGERLIEKKLAEELQASRGPIREALLQLVSEGFLSFTRNKGIRVSKLTLEQIDEIYSLRSVLEGYAVRLTAEKINKKNVIYLKSLHRSLITATKNDSLTDWTNCNIAFHKFFIENSGNNHLINMLDALRSRTYRYSIITITIPGAKETFIKGHQHIIRACESRDAETAQKHMQHHMEQVKQYLLSHLKEFPGLGF